MKEWERNVKLCFGPNSYFHLQSGPNQLNNDSKNSTNDFRGVFLPNRCTNAQSNRPD